MGFGKECPGDHRFHVADVAVVHDEGMVAVIAICLHCGETKMSRFKVSDGAGEIKLEKSKRNIPNE
jgi:hypothetical protein